MTSTDRGEIALGRIIGESPCLRTALNRIRRVAAIGAPVVIEGETGTGKELAARAIHYLGARREFPFVPVNCGALPDTLVENELFGHARGAFTGASGSHPGLLKLANHGTVFLDEVDSLTPRAQVVLLRFLQDLTYRSLGSHAEERADVRIIAASNATLEDLVRRDAFRADLYYRLRAVSVWLPPLRERGNDAEILARHFVVECARSYGLAAKALHPQTLQWLRAHPWPGNVRELENFIQQEFLLSDEQSIIVHRPPASPARTAPPESHAGPLPSYADARLRALENFDRTYLSTLLARTRGNVSEAARLAGKERRTLGKLMKRYAIDASAFRG